MPREQQEYGAVKQESTLYVEYDGVSQLVDLQRGQLNANKDAILSKAFAEDWGLDATGNWAAFRQDRDGNGTWDLDQTRAYNRANEVTTATCWVSPAHDRAGNMVTLPKPASPADALGATFDAWNRMVRVEQSNDEGGVDTVAEYAYTPDNRRAVKKTYSGGVLSETRHFYYTAGWQTIEERTAFGGAIAADPDTQYVWGDRYIDALILRDRDTTADGTFDERLYALHDPNWNVTALAETDGDIVERYTYTAYGTAEVCDADFVPTAAASAHAWQYTYTTRRLDEETGLMHYRARYYHPQLGSFVGRDLVGYLADTNLYRYCLNAPTTLTDPHGKQGRHQVTLETDTYEGEQYTYGVLGAHTHWTMYGNARVWDRTTEVVLLNETWCGCGCDDEGTEHAEVSFDFKFGYHTIYALADHSSYDILKRWFRERLAADYPMAKLSYQYGIIPWYPPETSTMQASDKTGTLEVNLRAWQCVNVVVTQKIRRSTLEGEAYLFKSTRSGFVDTWSPMEYVSTTRQNAQWLLYETPTAKSTTTGCGGTPLYYA